MPRDLTPDLLFHAAPVHRLPCILRDGALHAASVLALRGLPPRHSAARRDKSLGLSEYVHLSLRPDTPLLRDKVRKGFPHVLLAFDRANVLAGTNTALVPYNAKAWRTRAAFAPVTDNAEQDALLAAHAEGRYPSMEVLMKHSLSLDALHAMAFLTDTERDITAKLMPAISARSVPCETRPAWFGPCDNYAPATLDTIKEYFTLCAALGQVLSPPALPFD